jgi:hypothetical protein
MIQPKAFNSSILQRTLLVCAQQAGNKALNENALAPDVKETRQRRVEAGDSLHVAAEASGIRREGERNGVIGGEWRTQENPTHRANQMKMSQLLGENC